MKERIGRMTCNFRRSNYVRFLPAWCKDSDGSFFLVLVIYSSLELAVNENTRFKRE